MARATDGHPVIMDPELRAFVMGRVPPDGAILASAPAAGDLPELAPRMRGDDVLEAAPGSCAAVLLVDGELSRAGEHAEEMVDAVGTALEPGGVLVATVRNRVYAEATRADSDGVRGYSSTEATALLNHRGFEVEVLCAPGTTARLRGTTGFDAEGDRRPGLLDAAPGLLLIARAPRSAEERERVFFDSRPRKIAAAAVICRDPSGRVLVVYDRFKRIWTIPGGVVDADEDPAAAAQREAWEEAGTKVDVGHLLGVFASRWPDRLVFVFAASPVDLVEHPDPLHPHEISAVEWLPVEDALARVASAVVFKIRRCLEFPGFTWVQ